MSTTTVHASVLYDEALTILDPRPGARYIDCTLGGGGHAEGVLRRSSPDGQLLGLDADPAALDRVRERLAPFGARVRLCHANFRELERCARAAGFDAVQPFAVLAIDRLDPVQPLACLAAAVKPLAFKALDRLDTGLPLAVLTIDRLDPI